MCECEFDPYDDSAGSVVDMSEESWHFKRMCLSCGKVWWGLHCPHDGYQNPCPHCGMRPVSMPDTEDHGIVVFSYSGQSVE